MKLSFTFLGLLLVPATMMGQITLNQSSYTGWNAGTDSLRTLTAPVGLNVGSNMTWDLSTYSYAPALNLYTYTTGTNSAFPSATFKTDATYSITPGVDYMVSLWQGINSNGYAQYGESMVNQNIDLSGLPGMSPGDNLNFPTQSVVYSSPSWFLKFPADNGDNWISEFSFATDFNATISAMSISNMPGQRVTHATKTDSVKGWGKMRVKTNSGIASGHMDVLQIKTHIHFADSFFIGGQPVPNSSLMQLGLSQGMEIEAFVMSYYRAGEVTPLATVEYTNGAYTTPTQTTVHAQRLEDALSINKHELDRQIKVYPNPVTGGNIFIELPAGDWNYVLTNAVGQTIGKASLKGNTSKANIAVPGTTTPGLYFLKLYKESELVTVRTVSVQ